MDRRNGALGSELLLLLTAAIWGFAFVAQRVGMEHVGPFAFNGLRYALGPWPSFPSAWPPGGARRLPFRPRRTSAEATPPKARAAPSAAPGPWPPAPSRAPSSSWARASSSSAS